MKLRYICCDENERCSEDSEYFAAMFSMILLMDEYLRAAQNY